MKTGATTGNEKQEVIMRQVCVASDSTCDLSRELVERYDLSILPLHIILESEEFLDSVNITPKEIYAWSDQNKKTPKTSAFSPEEAEQFLKEKMEECEELIFFTISNTMSSSGNVMQFAAKRMGFEDRVYVIDSKNLSTGIGLQVIEAAIMAKEGRTAQEIVKEIETIHPQVSASFVVDTLVYLYRGGRCSGTAALIGSTLKLHPCIEVVDGSMQVGKKYRGKLANVVQNYIQDRREDLLNARPDRVFITHSGCEDSIVQAAKKQLEELDHFKEILITNAGGVVSSHCGSGTLGVLYIRNQERM